MAHDEPIWTSANASVTLESRYLRKSSSGEILETPDELFRLVARAVAAAEGHFGADGSQVRQMEEIFLSAMSSGRFLPNSPTLMNAGRDGGMLSACFVLPVADNVEGIFDSVKLAAQIQKAGGGTGFSFDRLRPAGDYIASSGGRSSGPISFWRVFCEATRAIQQGAFRRGANMGMMSIHHPDILKFVTAKRSPGDFENFNISVKVTDEFLRCLHSDGLGLHEVRNPRTDEAYLLPRDVDLRNYTLADLIIAGPDAPDRGCWTRREIWDLIVHEAWTTGEPGLCFIDRVNADNPTPALGRIEATNPCGEQPLLDYEACNLGSINVSRFIHAGRLDEPAFREAVRMGVRFLDDVIEINRYISPEIDALCRGNRKIGLGVMGLADALFEIGVKYDSDDGLAFGRRVAMALADEALAASEELAERRGVFPNWPGSAWEQRGRRVRNAALTCVAPTGTLSILAGCSGGIEPVYALAYRRHVLEGRTLLEVNHPLMRYAQRKGIWADDLAGKLADGAKLADLPGFDAADQAVFVTAYDIAPAWHVRMQAAFQGCIDGAISKTINLPASATPADVDEIYQLAYHLGCKGVTVYRDGSRLGQPMERGSGACPYCRESIQDDAGCSRCPHCGHTLCQ